MLKVIACPPPCKADGGSKWREEHITLTWMTPEPSKEFLRSYSHLHLHALGAATREMVNDLKNGENITYSAWLCNQREINYIGVEARERYHQPCLLSGAGERFQKELLQSRTFLWGFASDSADPSPVCHKKNERKLLDLWKVNQWHFRSWPLTELNGRKRYIVARPKIWDKGMLLLLLLLLLMHFVINCWQFPAKQRSSKQSDLICQAYAAY